MLTLRIVDGETAVSLKRSDVPLKQGKISIGRAPNNDVMFDDPAVSRLHCVIEADGENCVVHDQSANGVLVNNEKSPLGKGRSRRLGAGDCLRISRYVIEIRLADEQPDAQLSRFSALFSDEETPRPPPAFHRSFGEDNAAKAFPDMFAMDSAPPTAQLPRGAKLSWGDDDDDPLINLGAQKAWPLGSPPTADDHAPADAHYFAPPPLVAQEADVPFAPAAAAGGVIGDDWDDELDETLVNRPLAPPRQPPLHDLPDDIFDPPPAPPPAPDADEKAGVCAEDDFLPRSGAAENVIEPAPPISMVDPASPIPPPPSAGDETALIAAFFQGVGIPAPSAPWGVDDMRRVGRLVGEALTGLVAVLDARSAIRGDLLGVSNTRWEVGKDNNPLKFIRKKEELLQRALAAKTPDYLDGPAAVRDALRDVRAHELAMVNAVQTTGRGLVETFRPDNLKARLEASGSFTGLFAMQRKARYWETYELLYASMERDLLDGIHAALGERIAVEYENRLQELENDEEGR
ncbi:MAG TPA: type VI secretion system-associated FHA domain protein TagH [Azospirillaceae bacterium]|nr:type VI secretion system-associated FHA domain protein TagH [Azospirillaceae bacterium]HRQ79893.1 type VI secretion system-associated FHA domain protein TagH [Azospirillaceae bacterium]